MMFSLQEEESLTLNDVSFTVKKGEVFTIVGPVGNGKVSHVVCSQP